MSEVVSKKEETKKKSKKSLFKDKFTYIKDTKAELKRVSWSSKSKTFKDTITVLVAIFLAVVFSFGIDSIISFLLKALIK